MAPMTYGRRSLACGLVEKANFEKEIVAAGALVGESIVEIYTVSTDAWRTASPLPKDVAGAVTVPYENSFVMIGSYKQSHGDAIYQFDVENEEFVLLSAQLDSANGYLAAVIVDPKEFPQC